MPTVSGFGPLNTGLQYQLFIDPQREMMALAGLHVSWAHTGRVAALGAPDFTTVTPAFNFGKGFGDLPETMPFLRPFAITGNLSYDFPTKPNSAGSRNPNIFNYGFAFEYSLEYLQHHVKDVGLTPPFDRLISLVEVALSTPVNGAEPQHHRHGAARHHLGRPALSDRRRDDPAGQRALRKGHRRRGPAASLPRRHLPHDNRSSAAAMVIPCR